MSGAQGQRGFTISELVLVLVVLGVLVTIAVVSVRGIDEDNAETECRTELRALKAASEEFKAQLGIYPPDDQALEDAALLTLEDTPNWKVVTAGSSGSPSYVPEGDRCA
jgi:prepilin-type N-terminal cleavage/methylation domain-containing protein